MIREARPSDIPTIVEMGSRSLREGPYRDLLADKPQVTSKLAAQLIDMPNAKVMVSEDGGKLTGVFAFIIFPHYFSGEIVAGEVIWYVIPEARKSGCGLELLWAAEQKAQKLGAKNMQLTAPTDEIAAMYQKLRGYRKVETAFQRKLNCP